MNSSYWLAVAAYVVPTFPLGYFWHLRLFRANYERLELYRETVIIPFGLASMIVQALVYACVYPVAFDTSRGAWLKSALAFGAMFGALAWSFAVLPVAAKYRMTSVAAFVKLETAFTVVQYALVAPLIALAWRASA